MASSILKFVKKVCVQTAIYWEPIGFDGYGGILYEDPVEIKCRWTDTQSLRTDANGDEVLTIAKVMIYQPLKVSGYLYLGDISILANAIYPKLVKDVSPITIDGAGKIEDFDKIPLFRSVDEFVMNAYLSKNKNR